VRSSLERRTLIKALAGGSLFLLIGQGTKSYALQSSALIRPPGAESERHFLAACLRCGQCAQACPSKAIVIADIGKGAAMGSPYIIPRQQPCDISKWRFNSGCDLECITACPTAALVPVEKEDVVLGVAVIDQERCMTWFGHSCRACYTNCPFPKKGIVLNEHGKPVVDPEVCTGCGLCEYVCINDPPAVVVEQRR